MVDVVVDAEPAAKLSYDPKDIPEAVRKRAAAVDALYSQTPEPGPGAPAAQVPTSPGEAPPTQAPPAPVAQPAAPESPEDADPNSNTWKSRALSKEGRERAENEQLKQDLGELQEKYFNDVVARQPSEPQRRTPSPKPRQYLTKEDEQNYGRDLLDVAARAALQTVSPHIQTLEQQNKELRQRLAKQDRRAMDIAVEARVPNFREIDRNPRWHRWLLGIDVLSGRVRQTLLNDAISAGSAPRVAHFFESFLNEEAATGHTPEPSPSPVVPPREPAIPLATLAAPGRARPATGGSASLPTDKPTYTRAQIAELYRLNRRKAFLGREAEWARTEADIFAAQREGRIRD